MIYQICGKTYSNIKAVKEELELIKYSVKEGNHLKWVDTSRVFAILKKFGMDMKEFNTIIARRRTLGGRLLVAFNQKTYVEIQLSVSREIKRCKFVT